MVVQEFRRAFLARLVPVCVGSDSKVFLGRAAWCSSSAPSDGTEHQSSSGEVDSPAVEGVQGIGESSITMDMKLGDASRGDGLNGGQVDDMDMIRARVFGYHVGNGLRSGRKVLRRKLVGDKIASYYIEPVKDPLLLNLKQEASRVKLANLRRRGKGPPKKGQGKRTKK